MSVDSTANQAVEKIHAVIETLVPSWYGPGSRLLPEPVVEEHSWSTHFLATVHHPDGEIDLVVKIPLWDEAPDLATALAHGPQESTLAEYEALRRIEAMVAASDDPGLAAVRPVAYVNEINAVVTERLESSPLRKASWRAGVAAGRSLGRWLRRFHDEVGGASTEEFASGLVGRELEALEHRASGRGGLLEAAADHIRTRAEALEGMPVRIGVSHGDLGPSNVLVTAEGTVAVIDPNLVRAPVEADLAKLAVALRTPRGRLLGGVALGRRRHPVEASVLAGYGVVSAEMYALSLQMAVVSRWLDVEEGAADGLRRLVLPLARRVFAAEMASGGTGA